MPPRRTEPNVLQSLVAWAGRHPLVRALLLESSRANEQATLDALSDYDLLVVASDLRPFVDDDAWLGELGTPLVVFRDSLSMQGSRIHTCLVLYDDHTKMDFILWPVTVLREVVARGESPDVLDWGYRVLLDKDGLTVGLPAPTRSAHIPRPPTEHEYQAVVNEFWWETTYVAKNLWRDDLMPAKYSLEVVMKLNMLRCMLEWRIEIDRNWSWKPGLLGRELKRHLPPGRWSEFESTFAGADSEENWAALFAAIALFRQVADEVGRALEYAYSWDLDRRVTAYLHEVRALPH